MTGLLLGGECLDGLADRVLGDAEVAGEPSSARANPGARQVFGQPGADGTDEVSVAQIASATVDQLHGGGVASRARARCSRRVGDHAGGRGVAWPGVTLPAWRRKRGRAPAISVRVAGAEVGAGVPNHRDEQAEWVGHSVASGLTLQVSDQFRRGPRVQKSCHRCMVLSDDLGRDRASQPKGP